MTLEIIKKIIQEDNNFEELTEQKILSIEKEIITLNDRIKLLEESKSTQEEKLLYLESKVKYLEEESSRIKFTVLSILEMIERNDDIIIN